jgi:diguanylate cyclase (GGDEF)-like protein
MRNRTNQQKRPTIGMLITQIDGRGIVPIWNGAADAAREKDVNLLLFAGKSLQSPFEDEVEHNIVYDLIDKSNVDGLILVSGYLASYITPKDLAKFYERFGDIPKVSVSMEIKGIPSVLVDNMTGMKEAVDHLIDFHGHRRIAFVKGPSNNPEAGQRFQAYVLSLKEHGIPIDPDLIVDGDFRYPAGMYAVNLLLDQRKTRFDALVVSNDDMALGAYRELQTRGLSVPHEVALTGFDDIDEVQVLSIPFTTVHQPLYEQARRACEMVLEMIEGRKVDDVTSFPTHLVIRQSCGCLPLAVSDMNTEMKPVVLSGADFEKSIAEKKEQILKEIMKKIMLPPTEKKEYRKYIEMLISDLVQDIKNRQESGMFLKDLTDILSKMSVYENLLPFWHEAIFIMRSVILSNRIESEILHLAEGTFQRAQILISDVLYRRESYRTRMLDHLFWDLREIIRKINSNFDIKNLMKVIADQLPLIGLHSCFITLYQTTTESREKEGRFFHPLSKLVMAFDEVGLIDVDNKSNQVFPTREILPDFVDIQRRRRTMVIEPLFDQDQHYGNIIFELGPREEVIYETLRKQISSTLTSAKLFWARQVAEEKLRAALGELEISNEELRDLSLKDELTGLYNRRGLFVLGEQQFRLTQRTQGTMLLFFADVDGLKKINDTYGHNEGDKAIVNTAEVLKATFRQADILARFGGDEFNIIAIDVPGVKQDPEFFMARLRDNLKKFNDNNPGPYALSISLGSTVYDSKQAASFESLMADADKQLYKQKREHHEKTKGKL